MSDTRQITSSPASGPTSSLSDMRPRSMTKRKNNEHDLEHDIEPRPSKRANLGKPTVLDPIVRLNINVLNIVFDHIGVADIVRCERISRCWKIFVQEWMEKLAVARKLRAGLPRQMITNSDVRLSYRQIKDYACRFHNMRSGRVNSVCGHRDAYYSVVNGSYMAWMVPHQRDCDLAGEIWWLRTDSTKIRKQIKMSKLLEWKTHGWMPRIRVEMVMNTKGVLLLDVTEHGIGRSGTVAFSPHTMTRLWHHEHETGVDRDEVALAMGDSVAYCAVKQVAGAGYDLAALDLETGAPLYKFPLRERVRRADEHLYPWRKYALQPLISVVQDRAGQEFLFVKRVNEDNNDPWARDSATGIDVFNGRTGQRLHTVSFPDTVVGSCIHDPLTNHNLVAWHKWKPTAPALKRHSLGIFRPFSSGNTNFFTAPALAVCYTRAYGIDWLIDPLNMVAIGKQTILSSPGPTAWTLIYRKLEPIKDVALHDAAAMEVERLFNNEQGAMGMCLMMVGEARPLTAPHSFTGVRENIEPCRPLSSIVDFDDVKKKPFIDINPNGRVPAIVDPNTDLTLWESGAIIQYLIEQYDTERKLSYDSLHEKHLLNQWLHFQMSGQGPYYGQLAWFAVLHAEKVPSAITRYRNEALRILGVLNTVLEGRTWLVGDKCTFADLSFLPWNENLGILLDSSLDEVFEPFGNVRSWHNKMRRRKSWVKCRELRTMLMAEQGLERTGMPKGINSMDEYQEYIAKMTAKDQERV
ncbi:hypothetical protein BJX68DRAFT_269663 [Aspergillus pseudodeflectus]|uniref:glutathione transferase n=1 Tax=Aspergillus pseudodeflectus TaxID=176178 RepID=A0ABR4JWJ5_9EURO